MFRVKIEIDPIKNIFSLIRGFIFFVVNISTVSKRYAVAAVHAGMNVNEWELNVIVDSVSIGFVNNFSM